MTEIVLGIIAAGIGAALIDDGRAEYRDAFTAQEALLSAFDIGLGIAMLIAGGFLAAAGFNFIDWSVADAVLQWN